MVHFQNEKHGVSWRFDIRTMNSPTLRTRIYNTLKRLSSSFRFLLIKMLVGNRTCVFNATINGGNVVANVGSGYFYRNMFNCQ